MYYVYALIDPIQKVPFYIGKGKGDRMYTHLKEAYSFSSRKLTYIETIRCLGFEPICAKIIDGIDCEKTAYEIESFLIKKSKFVYGHPLVNRTGIDNRPPSQLGKKWSKESIEKRSDTVRRTGVQKGKIISSEQRQRISEANKGKQGPNKAFVDVDTLRDLYLVQLKTKKEVCAILNVGLGSLNRILSENNIKKDISNLVNCYDESGMLVSVSKDVYSKMKGVRYKHVNSKE